MRVWGGEGDGEGGEPWGFSNLHFSNSFLLCSPREAASKWNKHLTFAKCWWSGPDRQGCVWWLVSCLKQEFKLCLFHFFSPQSGETEEGRRQNRGSLPRLDLEVSIVGPLPWQPATSCWEPHSGHLSARVFYLGVPLRSFQEKPLGIQGQGSQAGAGLRSTKPCLPERGEGGRRTGVYVALGMR